MMLQDVGPIIGSIFVIAVIVWVVTEVVARALDRAGIKDRPWAQIILHLLPLALGVFVLTTTATLDFVLDSPLFGHELLEPLGTGDEVLLGLLCGAVAVLCHNKIGWFLRRKLPLFTEEKER